MSLRKDLKKAIKIQEVTSITKIKQATQGGPAPSIPSGVLSAKAEKKPPKEEKVDLVKALKGKVITNLPVGDKYRVTREFKFRIAIVNPNSTGPAEPIPPDKCVYVASSRNDDAYIPNYVLPDLLTKGYAKYKKNIAPQGSPVVEREYEVTLTK